jgi:hypothetical protein
MAQMRRKAAAFSFTAARAAAAPSALQEARRQPAEEAAEAKPARGRDCAARLGGCRRRRLRCRHRAGRRCRRRESRRSRERALDDGNRERADIVVAIAVEVVRSDPRDEVVVARRGNVGLRPHDARVAAHHRPRQRAQRGVEPGDDRLPLRDIALRRGIARSNTVSPCSTQRTYACASRTTPTNGRWIERAQAASVSAPRVRASTRMPTAATLQRPLATRGSAISSAKHSPADSRSKIELQTGITMTSAKGDDARQVEAAQPAGRVEDDVGDSRRRPQTRFGSTAQPTIGALFGRSRRARARSHVCVDCWRSTSPSMTGTPAFA